MQWRNCFHKYSNNYKYISWREEIVHLIERTEFEIRITSILQQQAVIAKTVWAVFDQQSNHKANTKWQHR